MPMTGVSFLLLPFNLSETNPEQAEPSLPPAAVHTQEEGTSLLLFLDIYSVPAGRPWHRQPDCQGSIALTCPILRHGTDISRRREGGAFERTLLGRTAPQPQTALEGLHTWVIPFAQVVNTPSA